MARMWFVLINILFAHENYEFSVLVGQNVRSSPPVDSVQILFIFTIFCLLARPNIMRGVLKFLNINVNYLILFVILSDFTSYILNLCYEAEELLGLLSAVNKFIPLSL